MAMTCQYDGLDGVGQPDLRCCAAVACVCTPNWVEETSKVRVQVVYMYILSHTVKSAHELCCGAFL